MPDTAEALGRMRAEALATLAALDGQIASVVAARADANGDDEHDPEGATVGYERAQADALRAAAERRMRAIDAALDRLAGGTYGRCAVCGEPIGAGRLEVRPFASTCIRHA